uniref:Putative wrky transcription factor 13 n=1 Tax=Lilium longiflorum TaxID=4690 RepID=A0A5P8I3Y2_LILLO|nr:putative wrky transcription factor 13 [Lilium longiflorum]
MSMEEPRAKLSRVCIRTDPWDSSLVVKDRYEWRKYGQKVVKNTQHPRSYYRCVRDNCRVKKRVERLAEDPRMVITTYEGRHAHSPPRDEDEPEASSHTTLFW